MYQMVVLNGFKSHVGTGIHCVRYVRAKVAGFLWQGPGVELQRPCPRRQMISVVFKWTGIEFLSIAEIPVQTTADRRPPGKTVC